MLGKYTKILLVVGFVTLVAGGIGLGIYFASKSNVTTTAGAVNVGGGSGATTGSAPGTGDSTTSGATGTGNETEQPTEEVTDEPLCLGQVCDNEKVSLFNTAIKSFYVCPDAYGSIGLSSHRCKLTFNKSQDYPGYWEIRSDTGKLLRSLQNQYTSFSFKEDPSYSVAYFRPLIDRSNPEKEFILEAKDTGVYLGISQEMYPKLVGINPTTASNRIYWNLVK